MAYYLKLAYLAEADRDFEFEGDVTRAGAFGLSAGQPIYWPMPERARATEAYTSLPDVFPLPGVNCVSGRFRELVEDFEPGIHEFFPLSMIQEDGVPFNGDWYIFNCPISVDTLFADQSGASWQFDINGMPIRELNPGLDWVLSRDAIGGRHLWCGKRIRLGSGLFCSDQFFEELGRRKIKYIKSKRCEETDIQWKVEENLDRQIEWEKKNLKNIDENSSHLEIEGAIRRLYMN